MSQKQRTPLYGPDEQVLIRDNVPKDQIALATYQAFLYNQSTDRISISNAIAFWDWLPKYANETVNSEKKLPTAVKSKFSYGGQRFDFTQFPGTCRDHTKPEAPWVVRYPGIKEQAVELALMKLSAESGGFCQVEKGTREYGVVFSIRQLRRELEAMGHSYNHYQVVASLDLLTSSTFLLESESGNQAAKSRIISEYQAASNEDNARHAPEARWRVFFHRVVANAIESAQYRQYDMTRLYARRSCGVTLVKRLIFATNLAPHAPLRIRFTDIRETTSGLNYARLTDGVNSLEKEIKRLQKDGTIDRYDKQLIKKRSTDTGRLFLEDAEFYLYPSNDLISEIKAANVRQSNAERELSLSPRTREQRQIALTLA
ncbi:hypothetical protein ACT3UJ_06695 [Halomonas sp. 86]|uniref:hypothetical protein n=1 Tax=unclassified Halomonas TaxID=2609666 RepID=UPI0040344CFB